MTSCVFDEVHHGIDENIKMADGFEKKNYFILFSQSADRYLLVIMNLLSALQ